MEAFYVGTEKLNTLQIHTLNFPQSVCNRPFFQDSAQCELAWTLNLPIHRVIHLTQTIKETVRSWHTANSKVTGKYIIDLPIQRRVKRLVIQ